MTSATRSAADLDFSTASLLSQKKKVTLTTQQMSLASHRHKTHNSIIAGLWSSYAPVDQAVLSFIPTNCIWSESQTIGTSSGPPGRGRLGIGRKN